MNMRQATPLALFWFLIMGALGVFFPYYGLYLRENIGLDGFQVGVVFATLPLVGFFRSAPVGHCRGPEWTADSRPGGVSLGFGSRVFLAWSVWRAFRLWWVSRFCSPFFLAPLFL